MALVDFKKGTKAKVDSAAVAEGTIYITTDTHEMYVDSANSHDKIGTTYSLSKTGNTIKLTGSDGSSSTVTDTNTTYGNATTGAAGLMSAEDKQKLDGIATGANNYSLPTASASTLGGVKVGSNITLSSGTISLTKANVTAALGYTPPTQDTNTWIAFKGATTTAAGTAGYAPAPSAGNANRYLRSDGTWAVPPDTNTTYTNMSGATSSAAGQSGLVPAPAAGKQTSFLRGDGTWAVPTNTNTTYTLTKEGSTITLAGSDGSQTSVSDSDTTYSLSSFGITATAAELNKLDGVTATKDEINFLDGVTSNIQTQLNGKATSSHNHSASNITSGTLGTARGGTGITTNPSMLVNLGSTSSASVFATSPRPGITGTLSISHGGTGATSASAARTALGACSSNIIMVSSTQPTNSECKIWIKP